MFARSLYLMLNTGVLSLSVLTDENCVNIIIRRLESLNGKARPHVGEKVESSAEGEVQRYVSLAN